ncbi:MAG: hypothetical protein ACRD7E_28985, partial [Bryobacteraceae bacterium]
MNTRRSFLAAACGAVTAGTLRAAPAPDAIRSITLAPVECRFHKFVAMNSYDVAPKGHTYSNTLVRIRTGDGAEGLGVMG